MKGNDGPKGKNKRKSKAQKGKIKENESPRVG